MGYITDSLDSDEVVLLQANPSASQLANSYGIGVVLHLTVCLVLLVVAIGSGESLGESMFILVLLMTGPALAIFFSWLVKRYGREQAVTSTRVICKAGLVTTHTDELRLEALEAIAVMQDPLGKLNGYGTLKFTGRGGSPVNFIFVDNPVHVKKSIEQAIKHCKQSSEEDAR